ncbi:hypothetical protein CCR75_001898 [Bremia lactucae]|uniref:Uncharacterized protein n=1 Tax=Bremia lactucae TaxID=4779 RepID=A0A976FIT5_BRELC|nr:hypothetical protein CCR75_001898 [Bremia lactucae]
MKSSFAILGALCYLAAFATAEEPAVDNAVLTEAEPESFDAGMDDSSPDNQEYYGRRRGYRGGYDGYRGGNRGYRGGYGGNRGGYW